MRVIQNGKDGETMSKSAIESIRNAEKAAAERRAVLNAQCREELAAAEKKASAEIAAAGASAVSYGAAERAGAEAEAETVLEKAREKAEKDAKALKESAAGNLPAAVEIILRGITKS